MLILEPEVRQLPGPTALEQKFSTTGTGFNAGNSLSNVLLEQILLSDMNVNSSFTGEKIVSDRDCCFIVAPCKWNIFLVSHLSAFFLFSSFLRTSLAKKFPYYPAILNNLCDSRWFSSVRVAASLFGVL